MKKFGVFAAALVAFAELFVQSPAALATPVSATISLNQVYTGNTPDGGAPWLVATFEQTGKKTGTLTLTSYLGDSDFLQGLKNSNSAVGWAFYLDQSLKSLACNSGCAVNALFGGSYNTGPVKGDFNLAFGWNSNSNSDRFDGTDSAVYTLTFTDSLTGNPFALNKKGWSSTAHVQGITGGCSGWIVAGTGKLGDQGGPCSNTPPPVSVPEPAGLGVFGLGALMIGLFIGLRRRYA